MLIAHNPLVIPILELLHSQPGAVTEHQLISELKPQLQQVPGFEGSSQLALFRTHFLVMNALYQLQRDLLPEGMYLSISPLEIVILPCGEDGGRELRDSGARALGDYYLDLANLHDADDQTVAGLLDSFWQKYLAADGQLDALATLELPADADWRQIQTRYRQLAAQLHPDRGGDAGRFMRAREAFEILRRRFTS